MNTVTSEEEALQKYKDELTKLIPGVQVVVQQVDSDPHRLWVQHRVVSQIGFFVDTVSDLDEGTRGTAQLVARVLRNIASSSYGLNTKGREEGQ